jgi:predicted metal-dependent hydrolase
LFLRGAELFNAGYYWEAHEVWEALWHAHGRRGVTADLLKALIKLAAAGVKVREGQEHGVRTHARRAADLLAGARQQAGRHHMGLDLDDWIEHARAVAANPPSDSASPAAPAARVFDFLICVDQERLS